MTVPVRRGALLLLSLLFPIPPATVSFHGTAIVQPVGPVADRAVPSGPRPRCHPSGGLRAASFEIVPEGQFMVYGLGVSLARMRSRAAAGRACRWGRESAGEHAASARR